MIKYYIILVNVMHLLSTAALATHMIYHLWIDMGELV